MRRRELPFLLRKRGEMRRRELPFLPEKKRE